MQLSKHPINESPAIKDPVNADMQVQAKAIDRVNRFVNFRTILVFLAVLSAGISFAILLGLTPIKPKENVVLGALSINSGFVLCFAFHNHL